MGNIEYRPENIVTVFTLHKSPPSPLLVSGLPPFSCMLYETMRQLEGCPNVRVWLCWPFMQPLGCKDWDAGLKLCHYSQAFCAQSLNILLTKLHHSLIVCIPSFTSQFLPYSVFTSPLPPAFTSLLVCKDLGVMIYAIIIMQDKNNIVYCYFLFSYDIVGAIE